MKVFILLMQIHLNLLHEL